MRLQLTDLNPHGGIAANCLLLEWGPFRLVIDAGMSPKHEGLDCLPDLMRLRGTRLDLVFLTHCHLDHLGGMPVLLRDHPKVPLVLSKPSRILAARMLHNSCQVMKRIREEQGIDVYPLYTHGEIERMEPQLMPQPFGHPRNYGGPGGEVLNFTLHDAGHIPGAAGLTLRCGGRTVFATGDVLFREQKILPGARFPRDPVDVLILETTRGARATPEGYSRAAEAQRFLKSLQEVLSGGGSVLVPVFALGRMQEILAILHEAKQRGQLPSVPIYVSGLGVDLADYFDEIARKTQGVRFRKKLLRELGARKVPDNLRAGQPPRTSAIYLLSSGMLMPHTPSYTAAAALLQDPRSALFFVGYCDPSTPGGALLETADGEAFLFEAIDHVAEVRLRRERFDFSGHAGREELLDFARDVAPKEIVLTHGDAEARAWFMDTLAEALPDTRLHNPTPLEPLTLESVQAAPNTSRLEAK